MFAPRMPDIGMFDTGMLRRKRREMPKAAFLRARAVDARASSCEAPARVTSGTRDAACAQAALLPGYRLGRILALILAFASMPVLSSRSLSQENLPITPATDRATTIPTALVAFPGAPAIPSPAVPKGVPNIGGNVIATPEMVGWLTTMIRDNLPPTYEDDRKWNKTKKVWNGIRFRREGLKIETERRIRTVKYGTWTRYAIKIVDPDERLHIEFQQLEPLDDGKIAFAVTVDCALDVFGRLSQWVRDVQMVSISAKPTRRAA